VNRVRICRCRNLTGPSHSTESLPFSRAVYIEGIRLVRMQPRIVWVTRWNSRGQPADACRNGRNSTHVQKTDVPAQSYLIGSGYIKQRLAHPPPPPYVSSTCKRMCSTPPAPPRRASMADKASPTPHRAPLASRRRGAVALGFQEKCLSRSAQWADCSAKST